MPVAELFERNDAAFVGRVKKKIFDFSLTKNKYLIEVESSKKGNLPEELVVWMDSKCGPYFEAGENWIVFATFLDGKYWTDVSSSWQIRDSNRPYTERYYEFEDNP